MEAQGERGERGAEGEVKEASSSGFKAIDFTDILVAKKTSHYPGTREWVFDAVRAWLRTGDRLFWLVGGAGTGKSVASAKLFDVEGVKECIVAWHFCRHDRAASSELRVILESLSAMLASNLPGFQVKDATEALSFPTEQLFEKLIATPLKSMKPPARPAVIMLDALDELPQASLRPVLTLLTDVFPTLPPFVRVLVTSRDEAVIKAHLQTFARLELKVDEIRNREDLRSFLVEVARRHVKMDLSIADMEAKLEREFELTVGSLHGKLSELEEPIRKSKDTYDVVLQKLKTQPRFWDVLNFPDIKNSAVQPHADLDLLYEDAKLAREKLLTTFASEWQEYKIVGNTTLSVPVPGTARPWVDLVIEPGLKERSSAQRKVRDEYGGDARLLKDLARLTAECNNCERMVQMLDHLPKASGLELIGLRNKFASPSPLGYRDFNLTFRVKLDSRGHLCETQVNLGDMLVAKEPAHTYYEVIREVLPKICSSAGIVDKKRGQFESSVLKMLDSSILDSVVHELELKADGLFIYAALVAHQLAEEKEGLIDISKLLQNLPSGLGDIYESNFSRMCAGGEWERYRRVIAMICVVREPLPASLVHQIIGAGFEKIVDDLSVLFPVREGCFEVMHKSVVDWLQDDSRTTSHYALAPQDIDAAHKELAAKFVAHAKNSLSHADHDRETLFVLRHVIYHACVAGQAQQVLDLVSTFEFLLVRAHDPVALIADVSRVHEQAPRPVLKLLVGALRLALGPMYQDWRHLPGQLVGRLVVHEESPEVKKLLHAARKWAGPAGGLGWWCPQTQTLDPAGGNAESIIVESDEICCMAWSPDGKYLCTTRMGDGKSLHIWDVSSSTCVQTLSGHPLTGWHPNNVLRVAWSSTGNLCSGDCSGNILFWDVGTGQCVKRFQCIDSVAALAWDSAGTRLCQGAGNKDAVYIWDAESGACLLTIRPPLGDRDPSIEAVAWSHDDRKICGGGSNGAVFVWDLQGTVLNQFHAEKSLVSAVTWSPDDSKVCVGHRFGSRGNSAKLFVWDLEKAALVQTLEGHKGSSGNFVDWNKDGRLCSGGADKIVRVWDMNEGKVLREMPGHFRAVGFVAWNCKNQVCSSGSLDNTLRVWDVENVGARAVSGHTSFVTSVAWYGDKVCTGSNDKTVRVWDVETGECLKVLGDHPVDVMTVAWTDDGRVISGGRGGFSAVWNIVTGEGVKFVSGTRGADAIQAVAWYRGKVLSADYSGDVYVWDPRDGTCLLTFSEHDRESVNSVACNNDGKVCSGAGGSVCVWDIETGQLLQKLVVDDIPHYTCVWTSESQVCLTSSWGPWRRAYSSIVWDYVSGQYERGGPATFPPGTFYFKRNGQPISCDDHLSICVCPVNSRRAIGQLKTDHGIVHFFHRLGQTTS